MDSLPVQGVIEAFLVVKNRAPIGFLKASLPDATRQKLHTEVVNRLKETASKQQAQLRAHLASEKGLGRVLDFKSYWIDNYVFVRCTKETLLKLAERGDVTEIFENPKLILVAPVQESVAVPVIPTTFNVTGRAQRNLVAIGCRQMWKRGLTGKGRLVCTLDTGIDGNHRSFKTRWRGNRPGISHEAAWFDPVQSRPFPHTYSITQTTRNHGTHVLGIICGLDTARTISPDLMDTTLFVDTIGVAPEVEWISAAVIDNGANGSGMLDALEWAADPDGNPNTVEDVPDVVNNSWAYPTVGIDNNLSCHPFFWQAIDNLEAAGAVAVFAAGNRTHVSSRSIGNPADRGTAPFSSFAVGNFDIDTVIVDSTNTDSVVEVTGLVAKSSCIGPTECGPDSLKPETVAPGSFIYSSIPGNLFSVFTGTSMASPHVAGAVALLRQHNPNATVDAIKSALALSATDVEAPGPDTISGFGLINLPKALTLMPPNQGIHVYVQKDSIADAAGQRPYAGGIFKIYLTLSNNGVETTYDLAGRLSPSDAKSTVLQDSVFWGDLPPGGAASNPQEPFQVQLASGLIPGETFRFNLDLSGANGFTQTLNLTFPVGERLVKNLYHHRNGNVEFTLSNFGGYGFEAGSLEMRSLPVFDEGLGFERKTELKVSRLFEASFIAGVNDSMVSNHASNDFCCFPQVLQTPDADFAVHPGGNLQILEPGPAGGNETFSIFDDRLAKYPLGLAVAQKSYSYDSIGQDNFVLLEFTLKNGSSSTLDGLRAGLFFDFNFFSLTAQYLGDLAGFDRSLQLGYQYNDSSPAYRGIAAADTGGLSTFNAVRIFPGVSDGFTLAEKWQVLSSGFADTAISSPIDGAMLAAKGPFSLPPGDSVKIAFALVAATTLDSLKTYTQTAQNIYRRLTSARGDVNFDGRFSGADVVTEIYCVFLNQGNCPLERADMNCDGMVTANDIIYLINRVFLEIPPLCP
ncbi:MAG: S8 family serine peptidase [candidate division Zixibacteria bacterium]|nr:S8 family serine peptidase [candidate division Zixibacteria bacterium]